MMEKQTIVVKVGTSSLTLSDGTMDAEKIRNITTQLAALQTAGHHVILVNYEQLYAQAFPVSALKNGRRKLPINRLPLLSARAF